MRNFIQSARSVALAAAMMLPQNGNAQTAPETASTKVATVTAALAVLHKALDKDPVHQTEVANLAPRVKDGTIDSTDDEMIRTLGTALYNEYTSNPAIREKIMAVASALGPKEAGSQQTDAKNPDTLHADTKEGKKMPPINEDPEEKKARLAEEKQKKALKESLDKLNKGAFFKKEAWILTNAKGAKCDIKLTRNSITTTYINKDTVGSSPRSTAVLKLELIPGKSYKIKIDKISGANNIGIKMVGKDGKLTGAQALTIGENIIQITSDHTGECLLEITNTALAPTTTLEGIEFSLVE